MLEKLEQPVKLIGNCELTPPDPATVNPHQPPPNSLAHPVKEGENLISIANRPDYAAALGKYRDHVPPELLNGFSAELVNARTLIYFNFGTLTPEFVNWYLLNVTGCYHATEDRKNRRFSNHDGQSKSPVYNSVVGRAGKIYIPTAAPKPTPAPVPNGPKVAGIQMWARLHYEDGLFKILGDIADVVGGGKKAVEWLEVLEDAVGKTGQAWTPDQLRKIARLRRFVKPLRRCLSLLGKADPILNAADMLLGCRVVSGYLVMSYDEPKNEHYAWEVDLMMKGKGFLNEDSGSFTTTSDLYRIRTDLFNPEDWGEKKILCTMTGGSISIAIRDAFKRPPHSLTLGNRYFTSPDMVYGRPAPRDWQLTVRPLQSAGGGVALYQTLEFGPLTSRIHSGARRNFSTIMSK